jgi:hypothetical protein
VRKARGGLGGKGLAFNLREDVAGAFGEAEEGAVDGRVECSKGWEQLMADMVAGMSDVGVGGIAQWSDTGFGTDCDGLVAAHDEERTNQAVRAGSGNGSSGKHPADAADTAAPDDAQEDRFGLIVGGVAGDDAVSAFVFCDEGEELVAHAPGRLLEACVRVRGYAADVAFPGLAGDFERFAEAADEGQVTGRFLSKLMIEVGGDQIESERCA